jgi:hypothetical protein
MNQPGTLIAAFSDRNEAQSAVEDLRSAGFEEDQIGFALRGTDVIEGGMAHDATGTKDGQGAVKGIATGSVVGGILGAVAAAVVPGIGPAVAGAMLAGAAGGAAGGAAVGGIFGALSGLGASEEEAVRYQQEFQSGKAIVAVQAGERYPEACDIIQRHGGYQALPRN